HAEFERLSTFTNRCSRRPHFNCTNAGETGRTPLDVRSRGRAYWLRVGSVVTFTFGLQLPAVWAEAREVDQTCFLQRELHGGCKHTESILHATAEVDGGSFSKVFRWTGNFSDTETEVYALGEHLVVENEIVRVFEEWQFRQHFAAEGAVTGVILRKLYAEKQIFERREEAIGDVLINRHATQQSAASDDAGSENDIVDIVCHHAGHRGNEQWGVLIVGVNHDHDVGAG